MLNKIKEFAIAAHGTQKYGEYPYRYHLEKIESILRSYFYDYSDLDTLVSVGWLHDVVEDTKVTIKEIEKEFGTLIASYVDLLTDEDGKNRRDRKIKTYHKIKKSYISLIVKLADRQANIEHSIKTNSSFLDLYLREHDEFKMELQIQDEDQNYFSNKINIMWKYLNELAESVKYYNDIKKQIKLI